MSSPIETLVQFHAKCHYAQEPPDCLMDEGPRNVDFLKKKMCIA